MPYHLVNVTVKVCKNYQQATPKHRNENLRKKVQHTKIIKKTMTTTKMNYENSSFTRTARQNHHQHGVNGISMKLKNIFKIKSCQIIKTVNAKHCVTALILLTLLLIIYYTHYVENSSFIG